MTTLDGYVTLDEAAYLLRSTPEELLSKEEFPAAHTGAAVWAKAGVLAYGRENGLLDAHGGTAPQRIHIAASSVPAIGRDTVTGKMQVCIVTQTPEGETLVLIMDEEVAKVLTGREGAPPIPAERLLHGLT